MDQARILVVEDEKIVALEIKDQLHRLGYKVSDLVSTGKDAIEKAGIIHPDLVLMDIRLKGDIDGIQAAEAIRKNCHIPVVFLTAYADEKTLHRAKLTEPYGYLLKPFESKELHTVIEMALYRSKIEKKLKEHEQWLSTTLKSINEAVVATDREGRITFLNPVAESITGWKGADVVGKPLEDVFVLIDEKNGESSIDPVKRVIQKGESYLLQDLLVLSSNTGKRIPIEGSSAPIRDEKGSIAGVVVTFVDVTERKRSEKINTTLYCISKAIHSTVSLNELFQSIHESMKSILDVTNFYIALLDKEKEMIVFPYFVDEKDNTAPPMSLKNSKSLTAKVIQTGKVLLIKREIVNEKVRKGEFNQHGSLPEVWLGVPLKIKNDVIGVMAVQSYSDANLYQEKDVALLETISEQVAVAVDRKRSREEIKNLKEFNDSILQSMTEGIVIEDENGMLVFVNPAAANLLGYTVKELIGKHWKTIFPFDQYSIIEEADKQRIAGKSNRYEVELKSKKGERVSVLISGSPRFEGNKFAGSIAVFTDITEIKRVEEEIDKRQKYLESVLRDTPDAIITLDAQHRINEWNPGAWKIFGYTRSEVIGKNIDELITREDAKKEASYYTNRVLLGFKVEPFETVRYRKDGTPVHVIVAGSPIRIGTELHGIVAVYTDITQRKKAEEEIKRAKEVAEEMNQELKLAIDRANRAAVEAEMANATKSEFLANMSHEIRTPMNGIIGMTELTMETELTPVQREYLDAVKTSSESLLTIINDILDFSKIEAGRLDLEKIDFSLQDMLGNTLNTLAVKADKKGLELVCRILPDVPDELYGDPSRLRQIVLNLLSNAIKFTNEGEVVLTVEVDSMNGKEAVLHFFVVDTGIGIPENKQRMIFDAFTQADGSTTRKFGGTGLGLAISSNLVQMMDGSIWVESPAASKTTKKGGPGSSFHFTARLGLNGKSERKKVTELNGIFRDISILVVDDNETHRSMLAEILSSWGMKLVVMSSGREALTFLEKQTKQRANHCLVLIDAQMPEMEGFAFVKEIRKHPSREIDTILMLSTWDYENRKTFEGEGIQATIRKPIKQSDLLDVLLETLNKSGKISMDLKKKKIKKPDSMIQIQKKHLDSMEGALKILLAEDNAINQKLAITLLQKKGWDITPVSDGRKAVETWSAQSFDLILMDIQMPDMDGFEATQFIRDKEARNGHHIPIVAMTAHAMKGDREKCLAAGMDDYVSKPMKADELYAAIARVVGNGIAKEKKSVVYTISPIDLGQAMDAVDGDQDLLKELIHIFVQEYPQQLEEIHDMIKTGDTGQLERKAHSFKGAVGNFGAKKAFDLAYELESMGRNSEIEKAGEVFQKLKKEMILLEEYLTGNTWEKQL